jgi:tetratricopeptide (TPR) repeat protein
VSSVRPTFEWGAVEGAGNYTIQIRRMNGGTPVRYEVGSVHIWTLPADEPGLMPGATYAWTVAPDKSGRAAREQHFKVIGPDEYRSLAETLDRVSQAGFDPAGDGLFLTATVYTDLKLFYDARAALDAVEKAGAMNADAYMLKGEVLDELGRSDEARKAFDRADQLMGR